MRVKYQKVNLKSDIFKIDKTPQKAYHSKSKSPKPRSPMHRTPPPPSKTQQQILTDPNDLFQRVCCPNCRYLFKIIKNNDIFNIKRTINQWTQTDMSQSKKIISPPKIKQQVMNVSFNVISVQKDYTSNDSPVRKSQKKSTIKTSIQNNEDNRFINKNTYRLQELALPKNLSSSKPSLNSNKKATTTSKFVSSLIKKNSQQNTQRQKRGGQILQEKSLQERYEQQIKKGVYMMELDDKLKQDLKMMVMKNYECRMMDVEMNEFLKQIPDSLELAGYKKMLFWDYKHNEVKQ